MYTYVYRYNFNTFMSVFSLGLDPVSSGVQVEAEALCIDPVLASIVSPV